METLLLDAESSRFKDVCIIRGPNTQDGKPAFCGLVNAKNKFGAYVGYKPFYWVEGAEKAGILSEGAEDRFAKLIYCKVCTPNTKCQST